MSSLPKVSAGPVYRVGRVHSRSTPATDGGSEGQVWRFGDCLLDTRRGELRRLGKAVPLQPRAYALLCHLVEQAGQLVHKHDLLQAVWGTRHVTDAVLTTAMRKLRQAIGDTVPELPMVVTVRGSGYRFDAELRPAPATEPAVARQALAGTPATAGTDRQRGPHEPALPMLPTDTADIAPMREFWEGQLARALDLERRSQCEQALQILVACLQHLPASGETSLFHARLLRQRMDLAQARAVIESGLAQAAAPAFRRAQPLLWMEVATLKQLQGDLGAAVQACDSAMALIADGQASMDCLAKVLATASQIDFAHGHYRQAAQKSKRAMTAARAMNDPATVVTAAISHARAIYMEDRSQEAMQILVQAVGLAEQHGLAGLQAEAYMRLAFQQSSRWLFSMAIDCAQRAAALSSELGDLANWHRAQLREALACVEIGQLAQAQSLYLHQDQDMGTWKSSLAQDNLDLVRWSIDWRLGKADESIALIQRSLREGPAVSLDRRRRVSYRLMVCLLCTGQRAAADAVWAQHSTVDYLERQPRLLASFALADGDRARVKQMLRTAWATHSQDETETWHVLECLVWLMLEDGEDNGLSVLLDALAGLSQEQASLPLLLHLAELRRGQTPWDLERWRRLVRANAGLVNRHAWLLDEAACLAWLQGDGPKLSNLYTDACC